MISEYGSMTEEVPDADPVLPCPSLPVKVSDPVAAVGFEDVPVSVNVTVGWAGVAICAEEIEAIPEGKEGGVTVTALVKPAP